MSENLTIPRSKPFSKDYVILATLKHTKRSVDISISKTIARIPDFDSNPAKAQEVLETLSVLNEMRRGIESLEQNITKGNS
jgi:hypothetical protein